jgi:hypothetical protein
MKHAAIIISSLLLASCATAPKKQTALDGIIERLETSKQKTCFYKLDSTASRSTGAYCLDFWTPETKTPKTPKPKSSK